MLNIFNELKPFMEDNYRKIGVREYSRLIDISPPTASRMLSNYRKEGILDMRKNRNVTEYFAKRDSEIFREIMIIYWMKKLEDVIAYMRKELVFPIVILFGSVTKAEFKGDSDIDIAIFSPSEKNIKLTKFEKSIGRKIQIFRYEKRSEVEPKELLNNILNGRIIEGSW